MKKLIFSAFVLAGLSFTSAHAAVKTTSAYTYKAEDQKSTIKADSLPAPVKATLKGADYAGWEVASATEVKSAKAPYYEIQLKKGTEVKTVKLDKDGKKVE